MPKDNKATSSIKALDTEITIITSQEQEDYISLTDIAKYKNPTEPKVVVANWMRSRSTIEFLGLWEQLNNPNFNSLDFDAFKNDSGLNTFTLSPQKWISSTNAIGLISKSGRYGGGTFAHKDIAFEFASWVSPEFKLYIIKDYQRLKEDESYRSSLDWNVKRLLAKANYKIHTDAVKENLIAANISTKEQSYIYSDEADILNVALFGMTAKQWRNEHPNRKGNIRDEATINQLLVLTNLENTNALLIKQGVSQEDRLMHLRKLALEQISQLQGLKSTEDLKMLHNQQQLRK